MQNRHCANVRTFALVGLALLFAGCTSQQPTAPPTPGADSDIAAIVALANFGDIGCDQAARDMSPADRETVYRATAAARALLADQAPTVAALQLVLAEGVPERFRAVARVAVRTIELAAGGPTLPNGSTAYRMTAAFVESCAISLNAHAEGPNVYRNL